MSEVSEQPTESPRRHGRLARAGGLFAVAAIMAAAFVGYLSPDMQLQWESLMALCGF